MGIQLTANQLDVLTSLKRLHDRPDQCSRPLMWEGVDPAVRGYWAAPMDFDGSNGSHHSATAKQLAIKGLIDRYKNGKVNSFKSRNKSSCCYRINAAGLAYLESI